MLVKMFRQIVVGVGLFGIIACQPIPMPTTISSQNRETPQLESGEEPAMPAVAALGTPQVAEQGQPTGVAKEEAVSRDRTTPDLESSFIAPLVDLAIDDLSRRLTIPAEQIDLLEVRKVTWTDASLGCPQPGVVYAQVVQEGLLIRLGVGREMYFYHSGGGLDPFLCEQMSGVVPRVTPKFDEMIPPPDWEID